MLKRWIILTAVLLMAATNAGAQQQPAAQPAAAAPAAPAAAKPAPPSAPTVSQTHPRLLLTPNDLPRLRRMATARALRWRRLLAWALGQARQGAVPHDGPGLALAALVSSKDEPDLAKKLGALAVACALKGARFGMVQTYNRGVLLSKNASRDPLTLLGKGYKILRPNYEGEQFLPVGRYTASEITVNKEGEPALGKANTGDTYLLLQDEVLPAAALVRQVALTLDWAWDFFTPDQRRGVARWLISQAQFFQTRGQGCFDTESATVLGMSALAALASHGLEPAAGLMLTQVWQKRYLGQIRPCLANLGSGGGWFEGNTPGARAGLELVLFALAMRSATGERGPGLVPWFSDRLSYLLFRLLPGLREAPTGNYRQVAPGGDEVLVPLDAAELTRMQMMGLLSLRPDDRSAGAVRALLLDGRTPTMLAQHRIFWDFLWLDPTAPTEALATVALSHLAPATGQAVLRSDWSERSTWLGFDCGPHFAMHQHLSAASLVIFRQGMLALQEGGYDGSYTSHAMNYGIRSVAHNTLLVYDPKEYSWYDMRAGKKPKGTYSKDGGQRSWALFNDKGKPVKSAPWTASGYNTGAAPWSKLGDIYQVAEIEALEDEPRYAYARGRATKAYDGSTHKVKRFVRHLFLLRANGPDDAEAVEAVVVADDVELARKGLSVHFVLHFAKEPKPDNALKQLAPGRWRGPATPLTVQAAKSRLEVVPVWPDGTRLDITGGAGSAGSWVGSRNYPPRPPTKNPAPWRAEYVMADAAMTSQPMLNVLLPSDNQNGQIPLIKPVETGGSDTVGLVIKDPTWPRVVVLRLGEPGAEPPISYRYPPGLSRHLVAGLRPGVSYSVKVDSLKVTISPGEGLKSSDAGLLAFRVAPALTRTDGDKTAAQEPPRVTPALR
ncbi:MAG: heparinase II/III-family protein [Desulfarculaceae bacterium]|nr:heparinase II/III-family protein [Desulfarculaceae bacterium]MCF8074012.1 heparinase II/III-family protein [Desulfarculaceae bacterium]MCF8102698.1 heparinase II/III-family protein [Desulfarculaceae bacterium]MCF8116061.1 heparinase II/III-family protein [Desulfarculaceae bacterium]